MIGMKAASVMFTIEQIDNLRAWLGSAFYDKAGGDVLLEQVL